MVICGPVARSLGSEKPPSIEQGARHPPLLGTHRSFQLPGSPRTWGLGLRRFSGSPGAALPEAGVDWAGSQYFWAWALFFFFFLQVLFYQWFGQKNKLKPRGQHVLYKTCTCPEGETVAVQRPNFWSSLISTSREAPLYYARDHQKGSGSSWTHSFSDRRIILHPRTSWPLLSHLHPYL
jgi:hypothetical protein